MELLPRQFLFGVCAIALLAIGLADAVHGEAAPVVVGLARCSDCTRKNMNAEAAFKGLQVAVKCKNSNGGYESKAVGQVHKSGAFSVLLAADEVGEDGQLKRDCFAQLLSASSVPCPGQEPSKIVPAQQPSHGGKATFVALAGKVHQPSAECASAFVCNHQHKPVIVSPKHCHPHPHPHPHHPHLPVIKPPVIIPPKHDHDHDGHDHDHALPPAVKPIPPKHDHHHDHDCEHDHALPPVAKPPTAIYHNPAQRNAVTDPQLFKKMLPFLKKLPFFPPAEQNRNP